MCGMNPADGLELREVREYRTAGEYVLRMGDCPWLTWMRVTVRPGDSAGHGMVRLELYADRSPQPGGGGGSSFGSHTVAQGGGGAPGGGSTVTVGTNGR